MSNSPRDENRNTATFLALFGLLAVAGGLLFLTAMVLPQIFFLLLVIVGFVFSIAFHYVIWGRWLSKSTRHDEDGRE